MGSFYEPDMEHDAQEFLVFLLDFLTGTMSP